MEYRCKEIQNICIVGNYILYCGPQVDIDDKHTLNVVYIDNKIINIQCYTEELHP